MSGSEHSMDQIYFAVNYTDMNSNELFVLNTSDIVSIEYDTYNNLSNKKGTWQNRYNLYLKFEVIRSLLDLFLMNEKNITQLQLGIVGYSPGSPRITMTMTVRSELKTMINLNTGYDTDDRQHTIDVNVSVEDDAFRLDTFLMIKTNKLNSIIELVHDELDNAMEIFDSMQSYHEGFAIIKEEIDELWDEIKGNQDQDKLLEEAIQSAAMCIRFCLNLIDIKHINDVK